MATQASEEGGLFATLKYRLESSDWLSGKETSSNNRMEDLEVRTNCGEAVGD